MKKPLKRVKYIVDTFPSISERFIYREAEELHNNGYSIDIIAMNRSSKNIDDLNFIDIVHYADISPFAITKQLICHPFKNLSLLLHSFISTITVSPKYGCQLFKAFCRAASSIDKLNIDKDDIIHCQFGYITADFAKIIAEMVDKKWSISLHAWDIYCQKKATLKSRLSAPDRIFFCSQKAMNHVKQIAPLYSDKMVLMRHGINCDKKNESNTRVNIISVARLIEKKGIVNLIKTCKELKKRDIYFKCKIIGDGSEKENFEQLIQSQKIYDNVELMGELNWEEVSKEYSEAIVLVVPCIIAENGDQDGIPNVILEAMVNEVPVIASDVGSISELIENGRNGIMVEPGNVRQLTDEIEKILKNGDLREIISANARYDVKEQFDIKKNIKPMLNYFSEK